MVHNNKQVRKIEVVKKRSQSTKIGSNHAIENGKMRTQSAKQNSDPPFVCEAHFFSSFGKKTMCSEVNVMLIRLDGYLQGIE
jgi:hypothetical protein